jgi:ABC-type multidrug transport system fused ATPase/permease subunit
MGTKAKGSYSLISNLKYILANIWRWDKSLLFCIVIGIPVSISVSLIDIAIPSIILNELEFNGTVKRIIGVVLILFAIKLLLLLFENLINSRRNTLEHKMILHYLSYISEKTMDIDYELLEDPVTKIKLEKASQAASNNHTDAMQLPNLFSDLLINAIKFILFGSLISLLNPIIIVILLGSAGVQYLTLIYSVKLEHRTKDDRVAVTRKIKYIASISDNYSAGKDIRLFGMKNWLSSLTDTFIKEYKTLFNKVVKTRSVISFINLFIVLLRDGFSYWYLINLTMQGAVNVGEFILYFSIINQFVDLLGNVVFKWEAIHRGHYQISDIRDYLAIKDRFNRNEGLIIPKERISIELNNVSYTYPNASQPTLKNINLKIKEGEKIAIVGLNGAGKTTLIKLISGMYTPTEGSIRINGHVISDFNRDEYYKLLSSVYQRSTFLPLSIARNIAINNIDYNRVDACIRASGLDTKVYSLAKKADTPLIKEINVDGTYLSGGESQKLLMARALYKDAPIYILDEPTSALDPIAESKIYMQYQKLSKDKTCIFISHRLSSTRFCDRIVYMENGTIEEIGSHDELMRLGKKYAELFEIQSRYYLNNTNEVLVS